MLEKCENNSIYSQEAFPYMLKAGKLAASILDHLTKIIKPGITTEEIDEFCHNMTVNNGAIPATLNYQGFPKSCCTSINSVVCHGIPGNLQLRDGDIINVDVTVILDGWYGDTSRMYYVGKPNRIAKRLCDASYNAMIAGINASVPMNTIGDVGFAIQEETKRCGFSYIENFTGHGIGRVFHSEPYIFSFGKPKEGVLIEKGMIYTVEPILTNGDGRTILSKEDGWTVRTKDFSLAAQFEHTIGIGEDGMVVVFTKSPSGFTKPPYNIDDIVSYQP